MLPQNTQSVKGWKALFEAGREAARNGIVLDGNQSLFAKSGNQVEFELIQKRQAAEIALRNAQRSTAMPVGDAAISDDGLWLV